MSNVVTIDGPVSSGKSSVANLFAKKIGYQYIDTGAIYRVFSAFVLDKNLSLENSEQLGKELEKINIEFKDVGGYHRVFAKGVDITDRLHTPEITKIVPVVAAIAKVREVARIIQRRVGMAQNTVMTGRDIGTEIFPEAKLKFYITATPEVRAQRRFNQLVKINPNISKEEVLKQVIERDKMDMERDVSPLRIPKGAIIVDTSNKTVEESVVELMKHFKQI